MGRFGTCEVELQLVICDYNALTQAYTQKAFGPKINVRFEYSDQTHSVDSPDSDLQSLPTARYNLCGQQLSQPQRGINIVRLSNGKTVKYNVQ